MKWTSGWPVPVRTRRPRPCASLEEAEFAIPGYILADIALCGPPRQAADGSVEISLEALMIAD